jgi:signal transduction histidine kinase
MPPKIDPAERIAALHRSGLLDSPREPTFDRLTAFASAVLKVPVTLMTLIDSDRQFFKSAFGLPGPISGMRETPLSHAFCQHVTSSGRMFLVEDARSHPIVKDNPAVSDFGIVAYAGVPLNDSVGYTLGSLCAIDSRPRQWSQEEIELLKALAAQVMTEMALREHARGLVASVEELQEVETERRSMTQLTVHDLRTPLTSLSMGLEMLPLLGPLNAEQEEALKLLMRGSHVLRGLVDDILDIGSLHQRGQRALTYNRCQPSDLVAGAVEQITALAATKQINVVREIAPDLPSFDGDGDKITRVLVNLLGNALKFTPAGGNVRITSCADTEVLGLPGIGFSVSDSGIGIAPENQRRIFEQGVKLDSAAPTSKSAGLGLTFCQRIVEAHGGQIRLTSALGQGSRFDFVLPLTAPSSQVG